MQGRYSSTTNKFTFYVRNDHFLKDYYEDDEGRTPTEIQRNPYLVLISDEPATAWIDWGDTDDDEEKKLDNEEKKLDKKTFRQTSKGEYVCMFRCLNDITYKGAGNGNWPYRTSTGEELVPCANYKYKSKAGDKNELRTIQITCDKDIKAIHSALNVMTDFPLLQSSTLKSIHVEYAKDMTDIPIDRLSALRELTSLKLIDKKFNASKIPDALFELKNLRSLSLSGIFNLSDSDNSNIRKIGNLKELVSLDLSQSDVKIYPKELLSLTKLKSLNLTSRVSGEKAPTYNEIKAINTNLTTYSTLVEAGGRKDFDDLTGIGNIENLATYSCWSSWGLDVGNLPTYLYEMRGLKTVNFGQALISTDRVNLFIDTFDKLVRSWSPSDGGTNQFYGLNVIIYSAQYQGDAKPSDDRIVKIKELEANYGQKWTYNEGNTRSLKRIIPEDCPYLDGVEGIIKKNVPYPEEYYSNLNQD